MQSTVVTFPLGSVAEEAHVVRVHYEDDGRDVLILDRTPFHPVDHTWPDQPGDRGLIRADDGREVVVTEAVMAAVDGGGAISVGADIPVKRGTEGWTWLVGHRLTASSGLVEGDAVQAMVDGARRAALSRAHTACHLASLALDAELADLWRKDPGADTLGAPDFEGRANQSSRILPDAAVDEYRLGKSLRRAGFDTEALALTLAERESGINRRLATWTASKATSRVETDGETITDRRRWVCGLPDGTASILCGGTHAASLSALGEVKVVLDLGDPHLLVMTTTVIPPE